MPENHVPAPAADTLSSRVRDLLEAGSEEAARDLLRGTRTDDLHDPAEHVAIGAVAEALGEVGIAIREYNLSLRATIEQPDVILRIARLRADRGEIDRALRAYTRYLAMRPDDAATVREAAEYLVDCGRPDLAAGLPGGPGHTLAAAGAGPGASQARPFHAALPEGVDAPTDSDCILFATVFAGREGVHARGWASPTGRCGYSPVREPFTPALARQHLLGAITAGIYPVRMDGTAHFLAFDVDVAHVGPSAPGSDRPFEARLRRVHHAALRIMDALAMMDLPALLEDSGHKGRHVWVLFETPVPAAALRRVADEVLARAAPLPAEATVEVFPKQSRVAEGGLGNLIKLPLGVHRLTGRRSLLLEPATGRPLSSPLAALAAYPRVLPGRLRVLLEEIGPRASPSVVAAQAARAAVRGARIAQSGGGAVEPEADVPASVLGDLLPAAPEDAPAGIGVPVAAAPPADAPPYDPTGDVEYQSVLARCAVVAELARRVEATGTLTTDERVVLTHTLGHLARGPDAVNRLLAQAMNVDASVFLKSRLRGNPMSCPRVRARVPEVTAAVGCACRFDQGAGLYPSPVLHARALPEMRGAGGAVAGAGRATADIERLRAELARARGQVEAAQRVAERIGAPGMGAR